MSEKANKTCGICGRQTRNKHGFCRRNPACRAANARAAYRAKHPRKIVVCQRCGRPTASKLGVCTRRSCSRVYQQVLKRELRRAAGKSPRPVGRLVVCRICGTAAGYRSPAELRRSRHGFLCPKHIRRGSSGRGKLRQAVGHG